MDNWKSVSRCYTINQSINQSINCQFTTKVISWDFPSRSELPAFTQLPVLLALEERKLPRWWLRGICKFHNHILKGHILLQETTALTNFPICRIFSKENFKKQKHMRSRHHASHAQIIKPFSKGEKTSWMNLDLMRQ